jgi:hypothetical protein
VIKLYYIENKVCHVIIFISDCGSLSNPGNGTVTLKGQKYGDTAIYNCDKGYNIIAGDGNRTCGEGTWGGQEPTCSIRGDISVSVACFFKLIVLKSLIYCVIGLGKALRIKLVLNLKHHT